MGAKAYFEIQRGQKIIPYPLEAEDSQGLIEKLTQLSSELGMANQVLQIVVWTDQKPIARLLNLHPDNSVTGVTTGVKTEI